MGRASVRDIRRAQLTQAAFEALKTYGIRGTTLEKVAAIASVSKGVVLHHFADKSALFEAVLRESNAITRLCVIDLMGRAENDWERLYAIILGNFAPTVFRKEVCHAWICLCAEVPHNVQYGRIQKAIHARMRSNLLSALRGIVGTDDAESIAVNLKTLIDGIWLHAGLQTDPLSPDQALKEMYFGLDRLIPPSMDPTDDRDRARQKMEMIADILFGPNSKGKNAAYRSQTA